MPLVPAVGQRSRSASGRVRTRLVPAAATVLARPLCRPRSRTSVPAPAHPVVAEAGNRRGGGGYNRGPSRRSRWPWNAQGAFGRGGSKRKNRKSKAARRNEVEQMNAPAPGGVVVPRGDGSTEVRLRRGASIMDFAEKIGANPASLITVLFHLGEMATQTPVAR